MLLAQRLHHCLLLYSNLPIGSTMHLQSFKALVSLLALHQLSAEPHGAVKEELCPQGRCVPIIPTITVYCTETVTSTEMMTSTEYKYRTKTVNCIVTVTTCPTAPDMPCMPTASPMDQDGDMVEQQSGDDAEGGANNAESVDQWPGRRICLRWRFGRCIRWGWVGGRRRGRGRGRNFGFGRGRGRGRGGRRDLDATSISSSEAAK